MSIDEGGISDPGQPEPDGEDPFAVVLDEDFIRSATTREPSARARELKARWAQSPPGETGWRTDGPRRQDPNPESEPAEDGGRKRRRGGTGPGAKRPRSPSVDGAGEFGSVGERRPRRPWLPTLAITLVVVGIAFYLLHPKRPTTSSLGTSPPAAAEPTAASGQPSASVAFTDPDDKYFAGSPSLDWADNASGITPPAAAAVGDFSAATVASGYQQMEQLLVTGDLDATILNGGAVTDFSGLIDPLDETPLSDLASSVAAPSYQHDPIAYVTRFDPAKTRLLGHTVKVDGSMSASVNSGGDLLVTGDYRFVYAVGPAKGNAASARTLVHRVYQLEIFPEDSNVASGKIWLYYWNVSTSNDTCFLYDGFINPTFGTGGGANAAKTVDPYASQNLLPSATPSGPVPTATPTECDAVSRV